MRIVIDTNVFVSSFRGGNPRTVIDLWKNGKVILCLSKEILNDYINVLERLGIPQHEIVQLTGLFSQAPNVIFTNSTPKIKVVEKDPDVDKFIECAIELNAEYIITDDKALREVSQYGTIKIVNPKEFLDIFG